MKVANPSMASVTQWKNPEIKLEQQFLKLKTGQDNDFKEDQSVTDESTKSIHGMKQKTKKKQDRINVISKRFILRLRFSQNVPEIQR